jgi:CubicO group peptidase (beta-lactamase class C family)
MIFKCSLITFLNLFFYSLVFAQQGSAIIASPSSNHAANDINLGKIMFSRQAVPAEEFKTASFLEAYELTNKSNLFITVILGKTLTSYLQELAPELSPDSLTKIGNYQFSFFVDQKLIYRTNLLPGAPNATQQRTQTSWNKPLIDNAHEGAWWSQSAWNRFMNNGGDTVLTEGEHSLRIELKPYIKASELKVGSIIATGKLNIRVSRKLVINVNAVRLSQVKAYDGFSISNEKFDINRIKELRANIEADVFKHITSIVVIKHGRILIEEYFNGSGRDSLHDVRSVGKSFASTLTGIAIKEGYLKSEQQSLKDFYHLKSFKNYSPAKENVTIKELLTMSSAFNGDDSDPQSPGNEENMYPTNNWVKFVLDLPVDTNKYQGQWHYFTGGAMLIGNILDGLVPGGLDAYAERKLFSRLGISKYQWEYTPQHVANTAGGIRMNSLDFAKFGQLYQNGGAWKNQRVLTQEWVAQSFTKYKEIVDRKGEYYGYLFWNKTYHSKNKKYETFYSSGNGGNEIFVFKDQPLVIVITATAYGTAYAHRQADLIVEEYLLPAILR